MYLSKRRREKYRLYININYRNIHTHLFTHAKLKKIEAVQLIYFM